MSKNEAPSNSPVEGRAVKFLLKAERKQAESLKEPSVGQRPTNRNVAETKPFQGVILCILPLQGENNLTTSHTGRCPVLGYHALSAQNKERNSLKFASVAKRNATGGRTAATILCNPVAGRTAMQFCPVRRFLTPSCACGLQGVIHS
jgi:hypothetical protein